MIRRARPDESGPVSDLALRHALDRARAAAVPRLELDADPGAEAFYVRHGARRVGESPSGVILGRTLSRLVFDLPPT